ncbi:hypothetical protein J2W20_002349 [Sinomonas atrocyanea]|uniref:hypothetical protein n=1 Tax=Sinomonas atrocyanea TaxID=37927 RepID=UPI0027897C14|nr:hypothetical protein [Sinomonas atrocyanea]MDQ0260445.1 hypothetical protein [Sinomonas atrocyanea]
MRQDQAWTLPRLEKEIAQAAPDAIDPFDAFLDEAGRPNVCVTGVVEPAARIPINADGGRLGWLYVRLYGGPDSLRSGGVELEFDLGRALGHGHEAFAERFMRDVGNYPEFADAAREFAERGATARRPNVPLNSSIPAETIRAVVRLARGGGTTV